MKKKRINFNIPYFIGFFFLLLIGLIFIYSASSSISYHNTRNYNFFLKRHFIGLLMAVPVFFFFLRINLDWLFRQYKKIWIFSLVILCLVFLPGLGVNVNGANRWIDLKLVRFQPSEVVKYLVVIFTAVLIVRKKEFLSDFKLGVLPVILATFSLIGLIVLQPDVSTSLIVAGVVLLLLFLSSVPLAYLLFLVSLSLPVFILLLSTKNYLGRRFAFFNPFGDPYGKGYHLIQSLIAVQNGGFAGLSSQQVTQKMANLPEAHTDFIYSIIIEEVGVLGGFVLISLFVFLTVMGFKIALRQTEMTRKLVVYGFVSLMATEQIIHVFVTLGLFPTTGLPLPFISYGRTALLSHVAMAATILNISRNTHDVP